jgi:simple sugar transport system ATP-binding protein
VAIARALYFKAKVIILDEPTAALSLVESEEVLNFVRRIKAGGSSALFISHNIYHSHAVADRLVVLDRGRVVEECPKASISVTDLIDKLHRVAAGETR